MCPRCDFSNGRVASIAVVGPVHEHGRVRVLVVDDEPRMAAAIARVLTSERYVVDVAHDGVAALAMAGDQTPDLMVLDRLLPDLDGLEVIRLLRARGITTPVLMLTALGTLEQRVTGLDAGADDYLAKPFAFSELLARLRALGRRSSDVVTEAPHAGDVRLDPTRHRVAVGDRAEDLSAREYALLDYLIRQGGRVVTRQQILDAVWGAEPDVYSNVVDLYVHYLRRKLEALGRRGALRTIRGVGYALDTEPAP